VGRALSSAALETVHANHPVLLHLNFRDAQRGFYEKNGMKVLDPAVFYRGDY